jgi:hypothetical protein
MRSDHDNATAALSNHHASRRLSAHKHAGQVHRQKPIPHFQRCVEKRTLERHAGVADQHVDSLPLVRPIDHALHIGRLRHVRFDGPHPRSGEPGDLGRSGLTCLRITINHHHRGTRTTKLQGNLPANSARGPRHNHALA